jgi:hypothetical protein
LTINLYRITIQTRGAWEWVEAVEWRQRREGEDSNGAAAAWEIVDSDNEIIYLMILNK